MLHHPVLDTDLGYLLAPMNRGIRLTTGAEFAHRDAPPTPVQVEWRCRGRTGCFRWGPVDAAPGWARAPVCPICCRSSARLLAMAGYGSISATSTTA